MNKINKSKKPNKYNKVIKSNKYQIDYEELTGSNAPYTNGFIKCQVDLSGTYYGIEFNPNIVEITWKQITQLYILSTGHSIGPNPCKIFNQDIEYSSDLSKVLENSGRYFSINDTKTDRDFSIISHGMINSIPRVVCFPGKFSEKIIVSGIDNEPDKTKSYFKYGKTTGVTSAKIFLMLQKPKAKALLENKIAKFKNQNIYQIPNYQTKTLTVLSVPSNGVDNNITNKDYLMVHDEKFYSNTVFNEELQIEPNYQLYIYLAGFLQWFGYEPTDKNKLQIAHVINLNSIGTKWFEAERVGWVSLMGDSGAGFYSVETDESDKKSAKLLGINMEGCTMITVSQVSNPIKITKEVFISWTELKAKLIIGNWEIQSAQKCSLVQSIPHIAQTMSEMVGDKLIIK